MEPECIRWWISPGDERGSRRVSQRRIQVFFFSQLTVCLKNSCDQGSAGQASTDQCELASLTKPNGYCSPILPISQRQLARVNLLAELKAIQLRCSALELALTEPSLATLQEYYTLRLLGLVNDGAISMKPDDTGLSSDTSVITSGSQMGIAGPSVNLAQLDQPDALIDNNDDSYFHELFDFNSAALPLSFDIDDGVTTPFAEEATKDVSTAGQNPMPPNVSYPGSLQTVAIPAANITPARHHCPNCPKTFRRRSDRDRHAQSHNPNAHRFACPFPGCVRVGRHGFLRKDKLTQHQAHTGH